MKEQTVQANGVNPGENRHDLNSSSSQFYFKPSSWLAKINYINHRVLFNTGLMAVLVEKGGGKTTFMRMLATHLDESIRAYSYTVNSSFEAQEFFEQMNEALNLSSNQAAPKTWKTCVEVVNAQKKPVLVILDDAHHLTDEFLIELLNVLKKHEKEGYLHLCLLGDSSLLACLNQYQRRKFKSIIHTIEPGSLSEMETKTYVFQRLAAEGREKMLTQERFEQFYHLTEGQIARINLQLQDFFLPIKTKRTPVKRVGFLLLMFLLVSLNVAYVLVQNDQQFSLQGLMARIKAPLMPSAKLEVRRLPEEARAHLTSQILPYTQASVHMLVQPAPLRNILTRNDEGVDDDSDHGYALMDRVLVIPDPKIGASGSSKPQEVAQSKLLPVHSG